MKSINFLLLCLCANLTNPINCSGIGSEMPGLQQSTRDPSSETSASSISGRAAGIELESSEFKAKKLLEANESKVIFDGKIFRLEIDTADGRFASVTGGAPSYDLELLTVGGLNELQSSALGKFFTNFFKALTEIVTDHGKSLDKNTKTFEINPETFQAVSQKALESGSFTEAEKELIERTLKDSSESGESKFKTKANVLYQEPTKGSLNTEANLQMSLSFPMEQFLGILNKDLSQNIEQRIREQVVKTEDLENISDRLKLMNLNPLVVNPFAVANSELKTLDDTGAAAFVNRANAFKTLFTKKDELSLDEKIKKLNEDIKSLEKEQESFMKKNNFDKYDEKGAEITEARKALESLSTETDPREDLLKQSALLSEQDIDSSAPIKDKIKSIINKTGFSIESSKKIQEFIAQPLTVSEDIFKQSNNPADNLFALFSLYVSDLFLALPRESKEIGPKSMIAVMSRMPFSDMYRSLNETDKDKFQDLYTKHFAKFGGLLINPYNLGKDASEANLISSNKLITLDTWFDSIITKPIVWAADGPYVNNNVIDILHPPADLYPGYGMGAIRPEEGNGLQGKALVEIRTVHDRVSKIWEAYSHQVKDLDISEKMISLVLKGFFGTTAEGDQ
ncbi:hypothetical protein [Candidatus Nesciobacter abundans]|uniref:Uncharacterized protein n=1 Tax=Candidatus Nesciobacter abundans TaxID=2601668 RepID=A0A5C0UIJ2_9PROT|nr:hypothetical protein [Candidatus Nesciobacter abundans]QEK39242.1 hypothetical protein FZC36_02295 [Candidatus Nesciobacter abundans]